MTLGDFLKPEAVLTHIKAVSKKQLLQDMAHHAARLTGLEERDVYETLLQRERLGSTGIGEGVAIPHGKSAQLQHVFGMAVCLEKPIDFEALDGQPVDIAFLLLAPGSAGADHLKALARIARLLREPGVVGRIRAVRDPAALYAVLTQAPVIQAA